MASVAAERRPAAPPPARPGRIDRLFGRPPPPSDPPDGIPRLPGLREPENLYLAYAFLLSVAIAIVLEWVISAAPIPPGGDPGQWISSSYPWIHATYPSQVIFLGYPPLLFPLLGALVLLGGGPIAAGQLFVGIGAILLGVSTYVFARAVLHRPILALLVEGFALLNAPFMRLFFFGAYPTVLALVFMNLAFAAFLRWMGSYRPIYLFAAWVLLAATLLTHSLVGLVAVGALGFSALVLLAQRSLPKEVLFSREGFAGAGIFVTSVAGYYLGTRFAGIQHPNYLSVNALGRSKTNLSQLLYPFHLSSLPGVFGHHAYFTGSEAFGVAIAFAVLIFFTIAFLAARRRLPTPALLQGALILAVVAVGIVGWILSIVTDYRRFAYLLYTPVTLAVAYVFDYLTGVFLTPQPLDPSSPTRPSSLRRSRIVRADGVGITIAVVGIVGLLVLGYGTTVPALKTYETAYTGSPHSPQYLGAISKINHDGRAGSVLTDNTASARWTRALTDRNTYSNAQPTDFVFYGQQILDDERAIFAYNNLYGVTDGVTSATLAGLNASAIVYAPAYNAMREGVSLPIFGLRADSLAVTLANQSHLNRTHPTYLMDASNLPTFEFLAPGQPYFELVYRTPTVELVEVVGPHPPADGFSINLTVTALGGAHLQRLSGLIQSLNGFGKISTVKGSNQFLFRNAGLGPGGTFYTNVTLQGGVGAVFSNATGGSSALSVNFSVLQPGARTLSVVLYATTPGANNLIPDLPPILSANSIFANWSAAYVLLDQNGSGYLGKFTDQIGASVLGVYGEWIVLSMPRSFPPDPYLSGG